MREGEEKRKEEWWSTTGAIAAVSALFPLTQHSVLDDSCIWGIFAGGLFLFCRYMQIFCQGGSQVWVKEKLGLRRGGGTLQGFLRNADSPSQLMKWLP